MGRYERGSLNYTIGNALSALGREEDAMAAYEAVLADPAFADTPDLASQGHKNLGTSFERLGDEKRAVEHYGEALRLNPHLPEAHNALAQFYMRQGEWKDALAHLDQAVFTGPIRAKAAGVAGWRAIDAYEKALALDPDYDLAMFNLGGAHWNRGEKIEALAIWTTAIDRFPDHDLSAKLRRDMPVFFPPERASIG